MIGNPWLGRDCGSSRMNCSRQSRPAWDRTAVTRHGTLWTPLCTVWTFAQLWVSLNSFAQFQAENPLYDDEFFLPGFPSDDSLRWAIQFTDNRFLSSGYGHISPVTFWGKTFTIIYAIIGIPIFLILLTDFGKLFTRMIKFVWVRWRSQQLKLLYAFNQHARLMFCLQVFVRRLYYTGSCRKVRKTAPAQVRP